MRPRLNFTLACLVAIQWLPHAAAKPPIHFSRDIRPILSENCFSCHGPDEKGRQADLRLDDEAAAKGMHGDDFVILPGKPQASQLIARIESSDADTVMPPPQSHKSLTREQIRLLKEWIEQGAPWGKHWSFEPISRPAVPDSNEPNPIDAFVRAKLSQVGLLPAAEADRATLIRRVTLDLTGLPPTTEEVATFCEDGSLEAYQRVVDRLLKSPHYGERMAIDWLDAARFADSNGYQVDRDRELWPWRDWVIRAFNENKPFDQFTIEQLAGDLLPHPSLEQRIATGFHRNHMLNEEGGIIADEFLAEYTADRVETTAAVWLGQTFTCARCHDHKYDAFTQRDYYSMKAFFHNVPERGVGIYGNPIRQNAPPFIKLAAPDIESKLAKLNQQVDSLSSQLADITQHASQDLEAWASRVATTDVQWQSVQLRGVSSDTVTATLLESANKLELVPPSKRNAQFKLTARLPAGQFTALRLRWSAPGDQAKLTWVDFSIASPASASPSSDSSQSTEKTAKKAKAETVKLRGLSSGDSLAGDELTKLFDGNRKTQLAVSLKPAGKVEAVFQFEPALSVDAGLVDLELACGIENLTATAQLEIEVSTTHADLMTPTKIRKIATKASSKWTEGERKELAEFHATQHPQHRQLSDQIAELKKQITAADLEIPTTLVMEELPEPRETFVLMRGEYNKPGDRVTAATPAILPPLAEDAPRNRLGLAQWLVSPQNPLTARVTVNRLWQHLFGNGLVKTSEDFGSQGALPTHPELLDWLASEFISSGWDVKHMLKLMTTSATYRQQSRLTPDLLERDPENRLLARGPRHRLIAEVVRDQALAASGLLVRTIGGPSVKPYHPPGIYEQITAGNGTNVYVPDKGERLFRRSMYTYWKRSVPHPAMLLFDAPFRESCTVRRPRTNTALQALNLMNDPTFVEAARHLAERMMIEADEHIDARLTLGFRLLLARSPREPELVVLRTAYERAITDFASDRDAAQALLAVGEATPPGNLDQVQLAALTTIASTLINLDETIMKE